MINSVAKRVALRLRINYSLDRFLTPRIEEYTSHLVASKYNREEVKQIKRECSKLDRVDLVRRPRRNKNGRGQKKMVLFSKWDSRGHNVHDALKKFKLILYMNKENEIAFPAGSLISGFRRQNNIGEMIAPSKPVMVAPQKPVGGRG